MAERTTERRFHNPLDPRNPLAGVHVATMPFELAEGACASSYRSTCTIEDPGLRRSGW